MSFNLMSGTKGVYAVVVAAGNASRMRGQDKQFAILKGRPVVAYSLEKFQHSDDIDGISLVVASDKVRQARDLVKARGLSKVVVVVAGESRRQDSVKSGLSALLEVTQDCKIAIIHDGARPFVDGEMIRRGLSTVSTTGAAVAAIQTVDTIKKVGADGIVVSTPDRTHLWAVQTPQLFNFDLLMDAHRMVKEDVTDDATMVEKIGGSVIVFEGSRSNIKITNSDDLVLAEMIAGIDSEKSGNTGDEFKNLRWGTGFDCHRLKAGEKLILGGLQVPFELGLKGHSDGDVLLHAITSAVLGAAGLKDMGTYFPSSDQAFANVDSAVLLMSAVDMAYANNWGVNFIDATIIAQRPRLSPYLGTIIENIASTLNMPTRLINVKVTSTDGVGAIGRGDGIAAQAIVTVKRGKTSSE